MPLLLQTAGIDDKPRPFYNLGNSCFINASLTALFGPSPFRTAILDIFRADEQRLRNALWKTAISPSGKSPESPTTVPITHEERLAVTYVASRRAPTATDNVACGKAVVPWLFTRRFYDRDPEDAHEFLRALFSEAPRLNALAQGLDTPILRCSVCGSERLAFPEDFTQLGLALRHENHGRVDSVQTALDIFLEPEIMPADFLWVCDNADCPSPRQRPTFTHNLTTKPDVLCIQLKRWSNDPTTGAQTHETHDVLCNDELLCQGQAYDLRSVICHIGGTVKHGHYTCRVHHPASGGTWWYYNNSHRRLATPAEVNATARVRGNVERAYLVFYEKRSAT